MICQFDQSLRGNKHFALSRDGLSFARKGCVEVFGARDYLCPTYRRLDIGWTLRTRMAWAFVQPPNLPDHFPRVHTCARACVGARPHARTHVCVYFYVRQVRRLDKVRQDKALERPTFRPTSKRLDKWQ